MTWTSIGDPILISTEWQYTEPIAEGAFFRLKHLNAPIGSLFAVAQVEVEDNELHILDSQVFQVERSVTDVLDFPSPGCFENRRIAIKRLPKQPSLEQEVRRLFLPGYLQREEDSINIINRSEWQIVIEVSDYAEPVAIVDLSTIETKLDEISAQIDNIQLNTSQAPQTKTLTYASDGDENGVFYWLGTNYGTQAWSNPLLTNRISITPSSVYLNDSNLYGAKNLVDRSNTEFTSNGEQGSNVILDLKSNSLAISHYSIRQKSSDLNTNLRQWILEGSNNLTSWTELDRQNLSSFPQSSWKTFVVSSAIASFRYFRLQMNGVNSSGNNYLVFSEWELYGTLTT